MQEFQDAVEPHHRFSGVSFDGTAWDLSHLDAFATRVALSFDGAITVVVDLVFLFSCHCFTHGFEIDVRPTTQIPVGEIYDDGREKRVLDPDRYKLSREVLPSIVRQLDERLIKIVGQDSSNYATFETLDALGRSINYAVFFQVLKDSKRKKRLLLRIQSAYRLDELTKRQRNAKKVKLSTLLRAAYEGRQIRG